MRADGIQICSSIKHAPGHPRSWPLNPFTAVILFPVMPLDPAPLSKAAPCGACGVDGLAIEEVEGAREIERAVAPEAVDERDILGGRTSRIKEWR